MPTGSALADQYLTWLTGVLTNWVTGHPAEAIAAINSYTNDSPSQVVNGANIRTSEGRGYNYTEDQVKGVVALAPASATVAAAGGTGTFTVTSALVTWTASSDQAWLTTSIAGDVVTYTAAANPDTAPRSATIRVGGTSGQTMMFPVTQDAAQTVARHA